MVISSSGRLFSKSALTLLLACVESVGFASAGPVQKSGLRTYQTKNAQGEVILHVTNLDEAGVRIGGELPRSAPPPAPVETRCPYDHQDGATPPIIVNIYPASGADGGYEGYPEGYTPSLDSYYGRGYVRYPLSYRPYGTGHHRNTEPTGLFGRPRAIDTRPYSRGTASQRNRAYFRKN